MKSSVRFRFLILTVLAFVSVVTPNMASANSNHNIQLIEQFVEEQQELSNIPGLSLVIVEKGKTVYRKGFGYADLQSKKPITSDTLFEIGSTTKAFTGLAIMQLEKEGLLERTDDIQEYIPWLKLTYQGKPQSITIDQLLHHTSGIPSNSIARIPESNADNALELTVRTLVNQPLNRKSGSSFEYATINYDVLGLVIETVTKTPYDVYMKQQILEPLGMNSTFAGRHQVHSGMEMASGYKIGFMQALAYTAPTYRGNTPAGYFVTNANDIAKWMNVQLGSDPSNTIHQEVIRASHIPDQTVAPFDQDTYYASGWEIKEKNNERYISHAGQNPNFTSYFIMNPEEQVGVAVFSNLNTSYTTAIGQGVMALWEGKKVTTVHTDSYQKLDQIVTIACIIVAGAGIIIFLSTLMMLRKLVARQRIRASLNGKRLLLLLVHTLIVAGIITATILLPKWLLGGLPWSFIHVWAPTSITVFLYIVIAVSLIYYVMGVLRCLTIKRTIAGKVFHPTLMDN
ncbi:CubicO group peptidase (beta-lactamase class C family) [Fontibacillus phaseoli]|uniref:CubicO group peptidase (Beta-lactamase class C family) n=1 Tax=Fontibacillus phaseoli TaxID=1416533 RepID=A0A369BRM4_9BACL|nr:serine hydrolase domain-containing protein [Fontibacillus phaseoli]RCX23705.1 CubicO group peptidase (beta-lactamase class C family) [Fontibacillus phaseoli]